MKLFLLRHGQQVDDLCFNVDKGRPDPELSLIGQRQADLLGRRMQEYKIVALYASDLERSVQTAGAISQHNGLEIKELPEFREIDMGLVSLKGWEKIAVEYPDFYTEFQKHQVDIAYPGGESGEDVLQRAMPELQKIIPRYGPHENIAIVCHGGVIMIFLAAFSGLSQEKRFQFKIDHCSISIVDYDLGLERFSIQYINNTSHLK